MNSQNLICTVCLTGFSGTAAYAHPHSWIAGKTCLGPVIKNPIPRLQRLELELQLWHKNAAKYSLILKDPNISSEERGEARANLRLAEYKIQTRTPKANSLREQMQKALDPLKKIELDVKKFASLEYATHDARFRDDKAELFDDFEFLWNDHMKYRYKCSWCEQWAYLAGSEKRPSIERHEVQGTDSVTGTTLCPNSCRRLGPRDLSWINQTITAKRHEERFGSLRNDTVGGLMDLQTAISHLASKTQAKDNQSFANTGETASINNGLSEATETGIECSPTTFDFSTLASL